MRTFTAERWCFLLGLVFLSYVAGGIAQHYGWGPAAWLQQALEGGDAWREQRRLLQEETPAADAGHRATLLRPEKTYAGYTLITTPAGSRAYLVDMQGEKVHSWALPFSAAWPTHPHVARPNPDKKIFWFRAYAYPNGDLLAAYSAVADTPYGYGLAKIDKNSKLLWTYDARTHHDISVDEDGNIYLLTQRITRSPIPGFAQLPAPVMEDDIVVLSADGKERYKTGVLEAFRHSPYHHMIAFSRQQQRTGDYLHTNAVQVLKRGIPYAIPGAKAGQVLISMRHQNMIALVDVQARSVVWAARGPWKMQHQAVFTPTGTIMLFDNQGSFGGQINTLGDDKRTPRKWIKRSRVIEYDPADGRILWSFDGGDGAPLYSFDRGMQQQLPNGNILITSSRQQRILEITKAGETVWTYEEQRPAGRMAQEYGVINTGLRYSAEDLPFLNPAP